MATPDYSGLIPGPNNSKPQFMQIVNGHLQFGEDAQSSMAAQPSYFDVDNAEGVQLDILGQMIGVARILRFQPGGGLPALLPDDKFKIALKAGIMLNQWQGTKDEIYDFWQIWLPGYPVLIQDNQDMTMTVTVFGMPDDLTGAIFFGYDTETDTVKGYDEGYWEGFQGVLRDMVTHDYFTPRPAGGRVAFIFSDAAVFGYDVNSTYLQGYDSGTWAGPLESEGALSGGGLDFSDPTDNSQYIPLI